MVQAISPPQVLIPIYMSSEHLPLIVDSRTTAPTPKPCQPPSQSTFNHSTFLVQVGKRIGLVGNLLVVLVRKDNRWCMASSLDVLQLLGLTLICDDFLDLFTREVHISNGVRPNGKNKGRKTYLSFMLASSILYSLSVPACLIRSFSMSVDLREC